MYREEPFDIFTEAHRITSDIISSSTDMLDLLVPVNSLS